MQVDDKLFPIDETLSPYNPTKRCPTFFENWKCQNCNETDIDCLEEASPFWCCRTCGCLQKNFIDIVADMVHYNNDIPQGCTKIFGNKYDKDGNIVRGKISYGTTNSRSYKRQFYYRERLAQWVEMEPVLKPAIKTRFKQMFETGRYGCALQLSRAGVMNMCKDGKLCKYKENWKSILRFLKDGTENSVYNYWSPTNDLLEDAMNMFKRISRSFDHLDKHKLLPIIKGSKGRPRHHILHVNYIHRKIMEALGVRSFHREFPLLKTPLKISALDDVMKMLSNSCNIHFEWTPIIQVPKYKIKQRTSV